MATYLPNATDQFPDPVLFTPNFEFLDTALQRKQQQYQRGFSQVAERYNTLNAQLLHPKNIKDRDQFMKQALDNLKNLSAMDLSIPQNVQSAVNVFSPIYSNKQLISDFALAKHYQSQLALASADRTKDGGKNYNASSVAYMNSLMEAYQNDTPEAVDKYLQTKEYYTPFVDYSKKLMEIFDKYKPKTIVRDMPLGNGYTKKTVVTDYDLGALRSAIELSLNPQEKNQLRLDGIASKGSMYSSPQGAEAIVKEYTQSSQRILKGYDEKIKELTLQKQNSPNKQKKAQIDQQIEALNTEKQRISSSVENLNNADYFTKRTILQNMAGEIHLNNVIDEFALSKSQSDTRDEISIGTDSAFFQLYEMRRKEREYRESKEADAKDPLLNQSFPIPVEVTEKSKTATANYTAQTTAVKSKMDGAIASVKQHLQSRNPNATDDHTRQWVKDMEKESKNIVNVNGIYKDKTTGKELTQAEINDYTVWSKYQSQMASYNLELEGIKAQVLQSEANVRNKEPKAYESVQRQIKGLNGGQNIQFSASNGKLYNLTPSEFYNKVNNGQIKAGSDGTLQIDGLAFNDDSGIVRQNINNIINILSSADGQKIKSARAQEDESMNVTQLKVRPVDINTTKGKQLKTFLDARLGNYNYTIVGGTSGTPSSDLVIQFNSPAKGQLDVATEDDEKKLFQFFGNQIYRVSGENKTYAIKGFDDMGLLYKTTPSQFALYNVLSSPSYLGKQTDQNTYKYTINNVPLDNTNILLRVDKITNMIPQQDGSKLQDQKFYLFDNDVKSEYLMEFGNADQVIDFLRGLSLQPDAAVKYIEKFRAQNN